MIRLLSKFWGDDFDPRCGWALGPWWTAYAPHGIDGPDDEHTVAFAQVKRNVQGPMVNFGTRRRAYVVGWFHLDWQDRVRLADARKAAQR